MTNIVTRMPGKRFLTKIETSNPPIRALGITDYYSLNTYEAVVESKRNGRLSGVDLVFPTSKCGMASAQRDGCRSIFICSFRRRELLDGDRSTVGLPKMSLCSGTTIDLSPFDPPRIKSTAITAWTERGKV